MPVPFCCKILECIPYIQYIAHPYKVVATIYCHHQHYDGKPMSKERYMKLSKYSYPTQYVFNNTGINK